jgi:citrate synthase
LGRPAIHERLSRAWTGGVGAADAIRRCLVLSADHELNASTYAVRVVASTRASLGSCLLAGLAALGGPLHGGATDAVRAFMADQASLAAPETAIAARLARGERVPGFGHRLYPDGDPRASALLESFELPSGWGGVTEAVENLTGVRPNIDFALVAIERQLALPPGAAFAMFAVARSVGWIAHALEQWAEGRLIRPRASYVGP